MKVLDKIVAQKKGEINERKELIPRKHLEKSTYFDGPCLSLINYLQRKDKNGIIAEFKRASPLMGEIMPFADAAHICRGFMQSGASALSVWTDRRFYKGKNEDLAIARSLNYCPIIRKDFIIDEYQILEAKSLGADVVHLKSNIVSKTVLSDFIKMAQDLGMQVMCEIHDLSEINEVVLDADVIGINSRSPDTQEIIDDHHEQVLKVLDIDKPLVAENGIHDAEAVVRLTELGYAGFLIGSHFMEMSSPVQACRQFNMQISRLKEKKRQIAGFE